MATSCPPRVPQLGAELASPEPLTHWGHCCPCPHQGWLKSPQQGAFKAILSLARAGCLPPCPSPHGSVSQWEQGWSLAASAGLVAVPGCCCCRLCSKQELLTPAQGCREHTGPLLPPAAAAPRPALTAESARLLGHREWARALGLCWGWAPPSTRGIARERHSPAELPWHPPSLREGSTELGSARGSPLCCGEMLGSLSSRHNPLTVQVLLLLRGLWLQSLSCARSKLSRQGRKKLCPIMAVPAMLAGIYLKVAKSSGVASALKNDLTPARGPAHQPPQGSCTGVSCGVSILWGSRG